MRSLFYIVLILVFAGFSGCGKDDPAQNNDNNDNNDNNSSNNSTASSNNATSGGSTGSTGSNNATTSGSNNSTNNSTGGTNTSGTGGTTGTNNLMGVEGFIKQYADAFCEIGFTCTGREAQGIRAEAIGRFASEEECKDGGLIPIFEAQFADEAAAEAAGRLTIDETLVTACVTKLKDSFCTGVDSPLTECDDLFVGTVPTAGLCATNNECAGDARCARNGGCEGVCEPRTQSTCNGATCQADEFCDFSVQPQTCQPRVGNGGVCQGFSSCLEGSTCNQVGNANGTCQTLGSVPNGQGCSRDSLCGVDSYCDNDVNVCTSVQQRARNEQCDPQNDACELGTLCANISFVSELGTCLSPRVVGESCALSEECAWGLFCEGSDPQAQIRGMCAAAGGDGAACDGQESCLNFQCDSNVCVPAMACIP